MAWYIDVDKAIILLNETQVEFDEYYKGLGKAKSLLMNMKIEDVAPVIHAEWRECKDAWEDEVYYECTNCGEGLITLEGTPPDNMWKYCPCCGAKMDFEEVITNDRYKEAEK